MISGTLIFRFVANRLRDIGKIALMLSFVSVALLGCGGGGGAAGNGDGGGPMPLTFPMATEGANTFEIANDITGDAPARPLNSVIDGRGGNDVFELGTDGVVAGISFSDMNPTGGNVHLQNVETITIDGGMVTGAIDARAASAGVTFNLNSGMVGSVIGSGRDDNFVIGSGITFATSGSLRPDPDGRAGSQIDDRVTGPIDGGGGTDTFSLADGFPTVASANLFNNVLSLVVNGRRLAFNVPRIETFTIPGVTLTRLTPLVIAATTGDDSFSFQFTNIVPGDGGRTHILDEVFDGLGGVDTLGLASSVVVQSIAVSRDAPTGGAMHLQNIESFSTNGTVNGNITGSSSGETIGIGGMVGGFVDGLGGDDTFNLFSSARITEYLDGGSGNDTLQYTGAPVAGTPDAEMIMFGGRGGLTADSDVTNNAGDVRNIETHANAPNIASLSVRGIERLALSPALNLYGALSDALMQFGQQTAEGFALADLNPQTGRATQLISKDSPFTKGRIWAHKITHSGNGKGSIGLNLTDLTARAPSDYDYEMSLTQHGFDAPVVSSQWGDFGLRAVSHTMTGTIETNTAEANVSGYGAGISLLWRSRELRSLPRHNLTAHITALAGGYEVDAHTSPSNPQAVVNEVSEGSFSAINAVISAGVADKRELTNGLVMRTTADVSWQTLSLDDFTETGQNGIIINFDKATRFTARIGAGLEAEHWFSDIAFVHETSSGGTLSSGLRQNYRQHDGTAIEMKLGGKIADLAPGLTLKAFMAWRQSVSGLAGEPSARFDLNWKF